MRSRNYAALAEVARSAWERSKLPEYASRVPDRWEFMLRVVFAADEAARQRRRGTHPALKKVSLGHVKQAAEFRPLVAAVAREHGISYAVLVGPRRDAAIAWARFEAMWMIRHLPRPVPPSYPVIAAAVCRDNHTSAIYGVAKFHERLGTDLTLRARVLGDELRRRRAA